MLKNLVKIASDLDAAGFKKEADIVDVIIRRVASSSEDYAEDDVRDVASEEEIEKLLSSPASEEEMEAYEDVQRKVLEEEMSDSDVVEFFARQGLSD